MMQRETCSICVCHAPTGHGQRDGGEDGNVYHYRGERLVGVTILHASKHYTGPWRMTQLFAVPDDLYKHTEAAISLQQALAVARRQQAKSPELRAAMSLSRLSATSGQAGRSPPAAGRELRLVHRGL